MTTLSEITVLRISDNVYVDLNGVKLRSTVEVAKALQQAVADNPNANLSIEADDSLHYEAIGKAIYGGARAGFSAERVRILIDGKLM